MEEPGVQVIFFLIHFFSSFFFFLFEQKNVIIKVASGGKGPSRLIRISFFLIQSNSIGVQR